MNTTISLLKTLYSNKKMFIIALLVIAAFVIIGCSAQGSGSAPPSGPIGGGCG